MSKRRIIAVLLGMMAVALSGCGGGGGDDEADEEVGPPDASGAGLWLGSQRFDGQAATNPMMGIVAEEGDYAFLVSHLTDPTQSRLFFGTGSTNGNTFSANAVTYLPAGRSVPASMQGTIVDGVSITGSYSMTGQSASFDLTYQAAYQRPASLQILQGVYSNGAGTMAITIEANGAITAQYGGGCTFTGNVTVPHANRNYYRSNVTFANCDAANGPAALILFLQDVPPAQNNQLVIFEQHQSQTLASFIVVRR